MATVKAGISAQAEAFMLLFIKVYHPAKQDASLVCTLQSFPSFAARMETSQEMSREEHRLKWLQIGELNSNPTYNLYDLE